MPPAELKQVNTEALPVLKRYALATAKYPWLFSVVIASILAGSAAILVAPLYLKDFINLLVAAGETRTAITAMVTALGLYAAIMFVHWALIRVQMVSISNLLPRVQADLTNQAFGYLIHHGHEFFANNFAGTLTRRVGRYARSYQQIYFSVVDGIMPTLLFAVGVIVVLFFQNVWLGGGLLLWTLLFLALQHAMTKWRYHYKLLRAAEDSRMTGALSDAVASHSAIVTFAAEAHERKRLAGVVRDWHDATVKAWQSDTVNYAVQGFLTRLAQIGLLFGGLYLWWKGSITVGDVVLIQVYVLSLMEQINNVGSYMRQFYEALAEANEMIEILETPHSIEDAKGARPLELSAGQIAFTDVSFAFGDRSILSDFDLTIAAGEKVALVGPSGAGKTTITKLLLRLYEVSGGAVRIDGQDIREVTQGSLRENISFVPQEPALFHRTLRENIAYGRPDATLEEVMEAAKKAHAHEFIEGFPQGYDTYVGERGVKLSGA